MTSVPENMGAPRALTKQGSGARAALARVGLLLVLLSSLGLACGSTSSNGDGGGTGGTTGTGGTSGQGGATGKGGTTGTGGAGGKGTGGGAGAAATGGQGGAATASGISTACETCAYNSCKTQIAACEGDSTCATCVLTDYSPCITNQDTAYLAVCTCAKTPCPSCASYCP